MSADGGSRAAAGGEAARCDKDCASPEALLVVRTAELRRAKEAAERADAAKAALLSRMAHEFRTPMNAILGFARVLEEELEDPEHRDYVSEIIQAGERLLAMIERLPTGRDGQDG